MSTYNYSAIDKIIINVDQGLRTLFGEIRQTHRAYPAEKLIDARLTQTEKKHVTGLMRVNHAGEVCAQALYQGQALTAQLTDVREKMQHAADEEEEHLAWCEQRLAEVGGHTSYLNPVWFFGALSIGALAGWIGDKWSLGFVVETERQVVRHLQSHIQQLPAHDLSTKSILEQMQIDEARHAQDALDAGAQEFPVIIKQIMQSMSKVMTTIAYYI
jgi:ubiquinone biosynthesis monooxygenase Coq7